jgi:membrane-associated protease RseP (regulator of RpoE activity)
MESPSTPDPGAPLDPETLAPLEAGALPETPVEARVADRPPEPLRRPSRWRLSIALLFVTFFTTLLTGMRFEAGVRGVDLGEHDLFGEPSLLLLGLPYALSILAILGTHELGHYLACRHYGVDATPPFFLPAPPLFLFGTFGAFIRIRAPITNRRVLFDVGVAGPLAGFVVAVPVMILGVMQSGWRPLDPTPGGMWLGDCLFTKIVTGWLAGPPPAPEGWSFSFSSMAIAGWVGFLATALNLLPVGQLDGGHIAYAVSRRLHRVASRFCLVAFVVMGLTVNESWLFWATVMVLFSPRHPPLVDEHAPLSRGRLAVALLAAIIFAVAFIPDPLRPVE